MSESPMIAGRVRTLLALPRLVPLLILLVLGTIWGGTFTVSKIALGAGVSPWSYAFWQCAGAGLVVLALSWWQGEMPALSWTSIRFNAVCGIVGIVLPISAMYFVLTRLPAGVMAVVVATIPLFTYAYSRLLGMERFAWRRAGGVALGFAGALLILLPKEASLPSPDLIAWAALAFVTPALYAAGNIYVARWRPPETSTLTLTAGMLIVATLGLVPAVAVTGGLYPLGLPLGTAEIAILVQIGISSLGYILFFELIRIAGPVYFSQVGYVVTLTGMIWAMWIFDDSYSAWVWAASELIFAGFGMVNRRPAP